MSANYGELVCMKEIQVSDQKFDVVFCIVIGQMRAFGHLLFGSRCSAHGFGGMFRQEIVVVNKSVLQYTKNLFFLTENIHH